MATVKYQLRSKLNKHVPIYLSFSMGRGATFRCKTGFSINPKDWSEAKGFPKPNDEVNKKLIFDLKELETYLLDQVNVAQSKGEAIDKFFIEQKIRSCFNRTIEDDRVSVVNHVQKIIDTADKRKVKRNIGLAPNTIKNYKTFKTVFEEFQVFHKKTIYFTDIDLKLEKKFKGWLFDVKNYSVNYVGDSLLPKLKTVCNDARKEGIEVNPHFVNIETFEEAPEDRLIVTLSFEELDQIMEAELSKESLINTRKWLIIGCETGQRGGDLLALKESYIRGINRKGKKIKLIDLRQQKGGKDVSIPVGKRMSKIIESGWPREITTKQLNLNVKEVVRIAKIDTLVEGKKKQKKSGRVERGFYPKHELICSHTSRRSFATNYYKIIATPVLMAITGHTKESTFLKYINRQIDKDDNAVLFLEQLEANYI